MMARFTLHINLDNAAMQTSDDVGHTLVALGNRLRGFPSAFEGFGVDSGPIADENGNTVGEWTYDATVVA